MPDKFWYLRRLNLFEEMSDDEVERLSHEFHMWRCDARNSCLGQATDRVYLLKAGRIRLYQLTADGHELTTAIVLPGQMFGIGSLLGNGRATHAEALEESVICEAAAPDFLAMLARHPVLMARVVMTMAKQIFTLEETLESIAYKSVPTRLADLLISLLDEGETWPEGIALPPYPQEELGKMIGATREAVARSLGEWREMGLISTGRRTVVLDVDGLRRLTAGSEYRRSAAPAG
ncbi:MAG: Crp/Fnr family transcriptional regulator [Candidatus Dormibacteria bacterium]